MNAANKQRHDELVGNGQIYEMAALCQWFDKILMK